MRRRPVSAAALAALVGLGWLFGGAFGLVVVLLGCGAAARHGGAAPAGAAFGLLVLSALATAFSRQPIEAVSLRYAEGRPVAAAAAQAAALLLAVALVAFSRSDRPAERSTTRAG